MKAYSPALKIVVMNYIMGKNIEFKKNPAKKLFFLKFI